MRKISMVVLKTLYGIYNAVAISIVVFLFISQRAWVTKGNNRKYKKI